MTFFTPKYAHIDVEMLLTNHATLSDMITSGIPYVVSKELQKLSMNLVDVIYVDGIARENLLYRPAIITTN